MQGNSFRASYALQLIHFDFSIKRICGILAIVVLVFFFAFIVWVVTEVRESDPDGADEARTLKKELIEAAGRALKGIANFFTKILKAAATVIGWGRIYFWLLRYRIRTRLARIATVIFLIAGILTVLEKIRQLFLLTSQAFIARHTMLDEIMAGFDTALSHPLALLSLFLIEAALIWHHLKEPGHHHHERTTLTVLNEMLAPLSRFNTALGTTDSTGQPLSKETRASLARNYYTILSLSMDSLFKERRVSDLNISVMRPNQNDVLEVEFQNEPRQFVDSEYTFKPGEGAAGRAYAKGNPFYIPSIGYRHGVELILEDKKKRWTKRKKAGGSLEKEQKRTVKVSRMKVRSNVYKPGKHELKSVLSVPIRRERIPAAGDPQPKPGKGPTYDIIGVVNLSSKSTSAFHGSDFDVAELVSAIIGVLNR